MTPDTDIVEAVVKDIKVALSSDGTADGSGGVRQEDTGNLVLVETAGGVLSPAPSGSLQADAFRPMRLPVLLVGDGKLGGIGATLSALESLRMRGYSILGVALIAQGKEHDGENKLVGGGVRARGIEGGGVILIFCHILFKSV